LARPEQQKYFDALNEALLSLYGDDALNLNDGQNNRATVRKKTFTDAIRHIFRRKEYRPEMLSDAPVRAMIDETHRTLQRAISFGVADNVIPPAMAFALDNNAFMFSGFKIHTQLSEVGLSLRNDNGTIKSFDQFRYDVQQIHNRYNINYLRAEYQLAIHSSQAAANWQKYDTRNYDLQYRTAGDEDVRDEHVPLDRITLPADDPFWDNYYPPNGWRCRCYVNQVRKGRFPLSNSAEAQRLGEAATTKLNKNDENKAAIFRFNPGKSGKIFPGKHPYFPKGCDGCEFRINLAFNANRPECLACLKIREMTAQLRKEARNETLAKMQNLIKEPVEKTAVIEGQKKTINVHFYPKGNKHLYRDMLLKCGGKLTVDDLVNFDRIVKKATDGIGPISLYKERSDYIEDFVYFDVEVNGADMQLQVGRKVWQRANGQQRVQYVVYGIKKK